MITTYRWQLVVIIVSFAVFGLTTLAPKETHAQKNPVPVLSSQTIQPIGFFQSDRVNFKPNASGIVRFKGILGYGLVLLLCYLLSMNRKSINWRTVAWGLALQFAVALVVLNPAVSSFFFDAVDKGVRGLLGFAQAGIDFLFQSTEPVKFTYMEEGKMTTKVFIGQMSPAIKCLAFWVLPTVIFFSSLISVLYHLGVMQWVIRGIARAMVYMLKTSGAETLSCTANVFVGQTEAPILVRPFIKDMTKSELMSVMTGGFATVAGGVLAIYVIMLRNLPGIAGHLVTASMMAAPAALAISKLMFPETEQPKTAGEVSISVERPDTNLLEAAARGASDGMTLTLNIAAMLVAFVALVAMANAILGLLGTSTQQILGWLLSPLAWCMGVPWAEAPQIGQLMGVKLVLTELLAYKNLQGMLEVGQPILSMRSAVVASYALCGFANVASIGIQIGGIGPMAPSRRGDLARLGVRAMVAGALVSCLSGSIAGILV
ncbi:MAG: nucleoside transporter C-terminal domain-containing protein [Pseudomonadota bacterium]